MGDISFFILYLVLIIVGDYLKPVSSKLCYLF
jgi:hypothetical protein